jgi:hypothetical protein
MEEKAMWLEVLPLALRGRLQRFIKQGEGLLLSLGIHKIMPDMRSSRALVLLFAVTMLLGLAGCASSEDETDGMVLKPGKAFAHNNLLIKAWKTPPVDEKTEQPVTELNMLVSGPGWQPRHWVKLRQGQSFEGLTLESVDVGGDAIGGPGAPLVPVLIEDFSLKIESEVPKRYLILRDFSGEPVVPFYSDTAHPPLKK